MQIKTVRLVAALKVASVFYTCPHCNELVQYETSGLPAEKNKCHKCLKKIQFKVSFLLQDS